MCVELPINTVTTVFFLIFFPNNPIVNPIEITTAVS